MWDDDAILRYPAFPPRRAHCWWHIQIGTYASWLPGDARGFRSRRHCVHSSGDYRNPPPPSEHIGLRTYHEKRMERAVELPCDLRLRAAAAFAQSLLDPGFRVLVVSAADRHAHALAELPADLRAYKTIVGDTKRAASRAVRDHLPGRIWARGDRHVLVNDMRYLKNVFVFVRDKQGPKAAVWCLDGTTREALND